MPFQDENNRRSLSLPSSELFSTFCIQKISHIVIIKELYHSKALNEMRASPSLVFFTEFGVFFPLNGERKSCKFVRMDNWELKHFIAVMERTLFLEPVIIILSLYLLHIVIKQTKKQQFSYLFLIYSLACLLIFLVSPIQRFYFPLGGRGVSVFIESLNSVFVVTELLVFGIYFIKILDSKKARNSVKILICLFVVVTILFFSKLVNPSFGTGEIQRASAGLNIIEFGILLVAIFSYFIQLFTKPPTLILIQSPSFWISSGLFIYILVSLPMLLFSVHSFLERDLYYLVFVFHYTALALLLLILSKALLCRYPIII